MLLCDIANRPAFSSVLPNELPTVAAMTMKGNENIDRTSRVELGWNNLDVSLL